MTVRIICIKLAKHGPSHKLLVDFALALSMLGRFPLFKSFSASIASSKALSTLDAGDLLREGRRPFLTTLPALECRCSLFCSGADAGDALILTFGRLLSALDFVSPASEPDPGESILFRIDLCWEWSDPGDRLRALIFTIGLGSECSDPTEPGDRLLERDRNGRHGSEFSDSEPDDALRWRRRISGTEAGERLRTRILIPGRRSSGSGPPLLARSRSSELLLL